MTAWFDLTCKIGFAFYFLAALSSLGYLTKAGPLNTISLYTEKISRMVTYFVFIAVHVMRLSHTGSVCSGDYLPSDTRDDAIVSNYMIKTGTFFMTYIVVGWTVVPLLLILMVCVKGDKCAALALDAPK